ncbi:MAG: hypothetical protein SGJ19_19265 [Planctomycetia bacterium]|nr:hypothetical protein [Planctomycetia bacterium]
MTNFDAAQLVDKGGLFIAIVVPAILVWRYRWKGVLIDALFFWISLAVVGEALQVLDPLRDAALTDSIWVLFGWIGGLLYCLAVLSLLRIFTWIATQRRLS